MNGYLYYGKEIDLYDVVRMFGDKIRRHFSMSDERMVRPQIKPSLAQNDQWQPLYALLGWEDGALQRQGDLDRYCEDDIYPIDQYDFPRIFRSFVTSQCWLHDESEFSLESHNYLYFLGIKLAMKDWPPSGVENPKDEIVTQFRQALNKIKKQFWTEIQGYLGVDDEHDFCIICRIELGDPLSLWGPI